MKFTLNRSSESSVRLIKNWNNGRQPPSSLVAQSARFCWNKWVMKYKRLMKVYVQQLILDHSGEHETPCLKFSDKTFKQIKKRRKILDSKNVFYCNIGPENRSFFVNDSKRSSLHDKSFVWERFASSEKSLLISLFLYLEFYSFQGKIVNLNYWQAEMQCSISSRNRIIVQDKWLYTFLRYNSKDHEFPVIQISFNILRRVCRNCYLENFTQKLNSFEVWG